jgi:cobalt-zinc-cadmium efflux system membrane fusion protein
MVDLTAPISGVITDQEVTNAGGIQSLGTNPFTISDLSMVWVVCDVYENDLANVHVGDPAQITLNAFPDRVFKGTVSNVLPILDPSIRTGKVRIEVANPGMMKLGMFVTATFQSLKKENYSLVPSSSILHLHDRDWVFEPAGDNKFRRVEVRAGQMVGDKQVILAEIKDGQPIPFKSGQKVVSNVLQLETTLENQ